MPNWNGGIIGAANNPTISSAKGIWSLSEATKAIRAGLWPPSNAGADPYFENVTMLLSANGTDGANNNTFLDSSGNGRDPARNGNVTQGTFTPFSKPDGRWSNYFDGSGDYLSISDNAAWNMGSGDFTAEAWIYPTSLANEAMIMGQWSGDTGGTTLNWALLLSSGSTGYLRLITSSNGSSVLFDLSTSTTSFALSLNTWQHIAAVRNGNTFTIYVDGTSRATTTSSSSLYDATNNFTIGAESNTPAQYFQGYISNARVVKGTAVYTAAFTAPTAPLTAITNTSLLTCQSNRFIDNSTNAFAITKNGDVSVQTFSPFPALSAYAAGTNGGSGYFDGSGDYLTVADNAAFEFGSGDFTIELWVNTTSSSQYDALVTKESGTVGGAWSLMINSSSSTAGDVAFWSYDYNSFSGAMVITTGASIRDGGWHHIALVRNGSSWAIYIDGVSRGTQTSSVTLGNSSADVWIGNTQSTPTRDFPGYMSGLRIVKGTAVYTTGFTAPTAPPTAITNTSLLCNFTNGGIIDSAMSNDLETVGNAQISTTQSKFGGASMYFDGTGDYLTAPNTGGRFDFGTGDFTIEFWMYAPSGVVDFTDTVISKGPPGTVDTTSWTIQGSGTGGNLNFMGPDSTIYATTSATPWTSGWAHIAMCRSGSNTRCFVNGSQVGSTYTTLQTFSPGNPIWIGSGYYDPAGRGYNGYLDDVRITKGYARYTANFTAPVGPFNAFGD